MSNTLRLVAGTDFEQRPKAIKPIITTRSIGAVFSLVICEPDHILAQLSIEPKKNEVSKRQNTGSCARLISFTETEKMRYPEDQGIIIFDILNLVRKMSTVCDISIRDNRSVSALLLYAQTLEFLTLGETEDGKINTEAYLEINVEYTRMLRWAQHYGNIIVPDEEWKTCL